MSEKIYCKDCRFCQSGYCHRMPPTLVSWHKDALFPKVDIFDWCGMAERSEDAKPEYLTKPEDGIFVSTTEYENKENVTRINGIPLGTYITNLHQKANDLEEENCMLKADFALLEIECNRNAEGNSALKAENKKMRGLTARVSEFLITVPISRNLYLKQEDITDIYTIASEEDEKRRNEK
ncbi:MAG: hypothetical protein WCQ61_07475 [Proteiniphilum sp.]